MKSSGGPVKKVSLYSKEQTWTEEEDNLLRELYQKYDEKLFLNAIASELKKSHAAIACRANELGITRLGRSPSIRYSGGGYRKDLKIYVRSRWEANYARYLNFIKEKGAIHKWEYEPDTFEFHGIKRGTRFYTPDFKVYYPNGRIEYHEVKGWMNPKSKTALIRMKRYYPEIVIVILAHDFFKNIRRNFSRLIPYWEESMKKKI